MPPPLLPANEPNRIVYSVARLNREVRVLIERGLGVVWVEGELSNLSIPSSGHWYFSLKDREAQVRCAMFRQKNQGIGFTPRAGQLVLARGRVGLYEPKGEYQFIVEHLEEAGIGVLQREFERLKTKLAAEGLFALERKRHLPRFPRRIGIITSPSGAALRDILHILSRRFPPAAVRIYPTPVQGVAAVGAIVRAIETASARQECDVLILARGGGSLEDLWAFNDEFVAKAIFRCGIPLVSGVGHEVDFTIADFVADARAPTPSAAAEMVSPDGKACREALGRTLERLSAGMRREMRALRTRFAATDARLKLAHPGARLAQQTQRLDDLEQRLNGAMRTAIHSDRTRITEMFSRLIHRSPVHRLREHQLTCASLAHRLHQAMQQRVSSGEQRCNALAQALNGVSPLATLDRGFAIVRRVADGQVVRDAESVALSEEIEARVAHGKLRARIISKE